MTDPGPWSTGRLVQVERKIQDARGQELARLRLERRRLVAWSLPSVRSTKLDVKFCTPSHS